MFVNVEHEDVSNSRTPYPIYDRYMSWSKHAWSINYQLTCQDNFSFWDSAILCFFSEMASKVKRKKFVAEDFSPKKQKNRKQHQCTTIDTIRGCLKALKDLPLDSAVDGLNQDELSLFMLAKMGIMNTLHLSPLLRNLTIPVKTQPPFHPCRMSWVLSLQVLRQ